VRALRRMVLGTGSGVGKSLTVAGICRAASRMGLRVKPFKSQNMSNNSSSLPGGGEIARAQALQARAARIPPEAAMNPILLKPMGEGMSQVIFMGRPLGIASIAGYRELKKELFPKVVGIFEELAADCDLVVLEGAGSPAEINLLDEDIANTRMARAVGAQALLLGDIEQGGVFASLFGTLSLLPEPEREVIRWLAINKFRGDASLLDKGLSGITALTGIPFLGVMNHLGPLALPDEDSFRTRPLPEDSEGGRALRIAVVSWPHLSNRSDIDPFLADRGVDVRLLPLSASPPGPVDAILLPGTRRTMADLARFYDSPLYPWFVRHCREGGAVAGICGGYQMMGREILDPSKVESDRPWMPGLGLLPVTVRFRKEKIARPVVARIERPLFPGGEDLVGGVLEGYEIRQGRQELALAAEPLLGLWDPSGGFLEAEGARSGDGRCRFGVPVHGLFENNALRSAFYRAIRPGGLPEGDLADPASLLESEIERLADEVVASLDLPAFLGREEVRDPDCESRPLHAP